MKTIRTIFLKELPYFLSMPAFIWQAFFFCIPLLFIVIMSVLLLPEQVESFRLTLRHYTLFWDAQYAHVIGRSLFLAVCTAVTCGSLAFPIAYHLVFNVHRWRNFLLFFLMLPFWTNLLVQVYAWFFVLERYGLINTLLLDTGLIAQPLPLLNSTFAIYIVMVSCYMPFMIMPLYSSLEKFDTRLLEASADLGARPWQTFLRITFPLSSMGLRTGFFLVFIPSFGEFVIPALMGGGKHLYVGSLISHYFLVARNEAVGSAFTCIAGLFLLISVGCIYVSFNYFFSMGRGER